MSYPVISQDVRIQSRYVEVRRNLARDAKRKGSGGDERADHRFAEMLALQSPPRASTDREMFEGLGTLDKQFAGDDRALNEVVSTAKAHGYKPGIHDVYMPGLARFEGDPEAFVSPSGGRGQVRKVCESRGWACHGAVNVEGRQPESDPLDSRVVLGEDVIKAESAKIKRESPGKRRSDASIREEVISKHAIK